MFLSVKETLNSISIQGHFQAPLLIRPNIRICSVNIFLKVQVNHATKLIWSSSRTAVYFMPAFKMDCILRVEFLLYRASLDALSLIHNQNYSRCHRKFKTKYLHLFTALNYRSAWDKHHILLLYQNSTYKNDMGSTQLILQQPSYLIYYLIYISFKYFIFSDLIWKK